MRNSRIRKIRQQEMQSEQGMSRATFRRAKKDYSHGHNRVPQPNPMKSIGHPGFPTNTVQKIDTWVEDQPRAMTVENNRWERSKGGLLKLKKALKRTSDNRRKPVTRVISKKKK